MQQADKAMAENKDTAAFDYLDEVIQLAPDYVEGWNQRATLHYKEGNYRKSMSDINRVLAIEPRHFGAIAGMAMILTSYGHEELALEAWQRFLDLYPSERRAQKALGDIAEKAGGKPDLGASQGLGIGAAGTSNPHRCDIVSPSCR